MYNNYAGRNVIAPTLLCEHSGGGDIDLTQKKMFKYQILECLMQQSRLIMFWKGAAVYNPINLQHISEAIRWAAPYENIILNGKKYKEAFSAQQWLRIKGLKLDNKISLPLITIGLWILAAAFFTLVKAWLSAKNYIEEIDKWTGKS